MAVKRKALWIAGGAFVLLGTAALIGLASRRRSQFDYLYSLGPTVGALTPSGASAVPSPMIRFAVFRGPSSPLTLAPGRMGASSKNRTVLVFPASQKQLVIDYLDKKLTGAKLQFTSLGVTLGSRKSWMLSSTAPTNQTFWQNPGGAWAEMDTDGPGQDVAREAHMKLPKDGFTVVLAEEPDWLTVKIGAIMSFLHLR